MGFKSIQIFKHLYKVAFAFQLPWTESWSKGVIMGKPTAYTNHNCLSMSIHVYAVSMHYIAMYLLLSQTNLIWLSHLLIPRVVWFFLFCVFKSWSSKQSPPGHIVSHNICKSLPQTRGHAGTWTRSWTLVSIDRSYSTSTYFLFSYGLSESDFIFFFKFSSLQRSEVGDCNTAAFCFPLCCFPLEEETCLGKSVEAEWSKGYSSSLGFAFNPVVLPAIQHQLLHCADVHWGASASS